MAYSFAWEALDAGSSGAAASPFQCSTMTGVLAPGKRYEMVFQYTPNEDKLQVCKPHLHLSRIDLQHYIIVGDGQPGIILGFSLS